jgi:hypothetical protein
MPFPFGKITEKICSKCKETKPVTSFHNRSTKTKDGYRADCKDCVRRDSAKSWQARSKKHGKGINLRKYWPGSSYKDALANYVSLLESQSFKCAICPKEHEDTKFGLEVDHCHSSNKVRGLLCGSCNKAIGLMQNSSSIVVNAAKYLEKNNAQEKNQN